MRNSILVRVDEELAFFVETGEEDTLLSSPTTRHGDLPPGATPTGRVSDALEMMSKTVAAVVKYVRSGFSELNHPDELAVEFSVALKGTSGIPVVASGSTEAAFKISAKWKAVKEGVK